MYQFRITKYNPLFRNEFGHYKKDDWTSFSEVGRTFSGVVLILKEYEKIENMYIEAAIMLLRYAHIDYLKLFSNIKSIRKFSSENCSIDLKSLRKNQEITLDNLPLFFRDTLRENLWNRRFENLEHSAYVHFGYDYYMYVGIPVFDINIIATIELQGLFVEEFISPYLIEE